MNLTSRQSATAVLEVPCPSRGTQRNTQTKQIPVQLATLQLFVMSFAHLLLCLSFVIGVSGAIAVTA